MEAGRQREFLGPPGGGQWKLRRTRPIGQSMTTTTWPRMLAGATFRFTGQNYAGNELLAYELGCGPEVDGGGDNQEN